MSRPFYGPEFRTYGGEQVGVGRSESYPKSDVITHLLRGMAKWYPFFMPLHVVILFVHSAENEKSQHDRNGMYILKFQMSSIN